MILSIKHLLLTTLLGIALGVVSTGLFNSSTIEGSERLAEEYKRRQEQSGLQLDSVNLLLDSLPFERARTVAKEDSLYKELGKAYGRMVTLSNPKVTKETKKETLEWIRLYNSSL
jgi:hypothetical protein